MLLCGQVLADFYKVQPLLLPDDAAACPADTAADERGSGDVEMIEAATALPARIFDPT